MIVLPAKNETFDRNTNAQLHSAQHTVSIARPQDLVHVWQVTYPMPTMQKKLKIETRTMSENGIAPG